MKGMDAKSISRREFLGMLVDYGERMLMSGAEIFRVEDTASRMAAKYGAVRSDIFVITSSIVMTICFEDGEQLTQTRRVEKPAGTDFYTLEMLNEMSRRYCAGTLTLGTLRHRVSEIQVQPVGWTVYLGSAIASMAFAVFFGGSLADGFCSGLFGLLICFLQSHMEPRCPNRVVFSLITAFLTGICICIVCVMLPFLHVDKVMIGDIMLLIPGIAMTLSVRDMIVGETIAGMLRFFESALWATALALGFMLAIWIVPGKYEISVNAWQYYPVVQVIFAGVGTLGFAMIFRARKRLLLLIMAGGALMWMIYLYGESIFHSIFIPCMLAALFTAFYAEALARVQKVPAIIYLIPGLVPAIPGGSLFYTMSGLVNRDMDMAGVYSASTMQFAVGIAIGISIVWAISMMMRRKPSGILDKYPGGV